MGNVQPLDPDAILDYTMDWTDWLTGGEVVDTSAWTVDPTYDPTELVIGTGDFAPTIAVDGLSTTVWVNGQVAGHRYELTNKIVTDSSPTRTAERTITIRAGER